MTAHCIPAADLSAYYDGELTGAERRRVEAHMAVCPECREILAGYAWIGHALRESSPEPVPLAVDRRVRTMMRTAGSAPKRKTHPALPSLRPAFAGVALAAVLLAMVIVGLPFVGPPEPRVASAYLYSEEGTPTIEVRFTGPVNRETVQQSVRLDPPAEVNVSWRGDALVVRPAYPLRKVSYTLSVKADPASGSAGATPVAFDLPQTDLAPSAPSTPVALPTKAVPVAALATQTATPAASVSPTLVRTTTASPTPLPFQVVRGFGLLLRSQPAVAAALGAPVEAEHQVEAVTQRFQNGSMLWRGDRKEIIVLLDNARWRAFPDSFEGGEPVPAKSGEPARGFGKLWREQSDLRVALGNASAAEAPVDGVVIQQFEHGILLRTPDRYINVLFTGGSWDRYADSFQGPGATPSATALTLTPSPAPFPTSTLVPLTPSPSATPEASPTPEVSPTAEPSPAPTSTASASPTATATPWITPTPSATARSTPSATPTSTPATRTPVPAATSTPVAQPTSVGAGCSVAMENSFSALFAAIPSVATRLGCAQAPGTSVQVVRQSFEHGQMIWRSDTDEIYVLPRDGGWSVYMNSWQEGESLSDAGTPPTGLLAPVRGFGKLWRLRPDVRASLGWATADERQFPGVVQEFAGGRSVWSTDRSITVLYTGGSWQGFQDPTP